MSVFNNYRDSKVYAFIERVANFCVRLVNSVIARFKK
jgi:hypothetical protein